MTLSSYFSNLEAQMRVVSSASTSTEINKINDRLSMQKKQVKKHEWVRQQSTPLENPAKVKQSATGAVPKSSLRVKDRSYSDDSQLYEFIASDDAVMT
mmetsp:Transcript_32728/g.79219  ORF Transcript_32728/g.79219 Transcript_32728/m.79219 type:complete len:98 (-) Transcript_32728:217-510(-)